VAILSTDTVTKRPVVVTDSIGNDAIAVATSATWA